MTVIQQDSTSTNSSVLASMDRKKYSATEEPSNSFYSKYALIVTNFAECCQNYIAIVITLRSSGLDDLLTRSSGGGGGGSSKSSRDSDWDMLSDFTPAASKSSASSFGMPTTSSSAYGSASASSKSASSNYGSSSNARDVPSASAGSGEAQKKFGSAKAISSDQYFQDSGAADVIKNVKSN